MASGNKTVQVTAYDTLRFSWQENSQSIANNQTVVGWKVELIATDYGRINSTGGDPWSVTVNGTKYSGSCDVSIGNNSTKTLASGSTTIAHGSDGKKVFSYSFTVSFDGIYFSGNNIGVKSGSGSGTLTTIPRTSSFTIPESAAAGVNIPVSITRAVSSFTHDVKLQFGSKSQTYTGIATSVNVVAPLAWLDQIPNDSSGVLTITVTTKSGSTVIGSSAKTMKITVPGSVVPTVSIKAVTPIDQTWGLYIQGKSKVKIELNAEGAYGSTIKSYSIAGGGYTGTSNPYTTGLLTEPGQQTFICKVTDSRGRVVSITTAIEVTPYEAPKFTDLQVFRSNASGMSDQAGAYAYIKASCGYSSCGGNNTSSMTVAYKAETASSYGSAVSLEDAVGKVIGGSLATNVKYLVKITASDHFTSVYRELEIETDRYRAVFGENAAGILAYPPEGGKGVYVGDKLHLDENVGLHVMDLRDRPQTPDMFKRQAFAVYFARENGSTGNWRGILHTKGFGGEYDAFEIAGPASQGGARYLAWRCGLGETGDAGGSFAAWRTIVDSYNLGTTPYSPESYVSDNDSNETAFNNWLDAQISSMGDYKMKPIRFSCYPAVTGNTVYGILCSHGSGYAVFYGWSYGGFTLLKRKSAGTWQASIMRTCEKVTSIANGGTGAANATQAKRNFGIYQYSWVTTRNGSTSQTVSIASLTGSALTSLGAGATVAISNGDNAANTDVVIGVNRISASQVRLIFDKSSSSNIRLNTTVFNY